MEKKKVPGDVLVRPKRRVHSTPAEESYRIAHQTVEGRRQRVQKIIEDYRKRLNSISAEQSDSKSLINHFRDTHKSLIQQLKDLEGTWRYCTKSFEKICETYQARLIGLVDFFK